MKKINLIRMLQEGSSIMKKARGLLLLCTLLLMNVHAYAYKITGGHTIYFDNSIAEWTGPQMQVKQNDSNKPVYEFTQIGTTSFYYKVFSTDWDGYDGIYYFNWTGSNWGNKSTYERYDINSDVVIVAKSSSDNTAIGKFTTFQKAYPSNRIYFDATGATGWGDKAYFRYGFDCVAHADPMTKFPGTASLFYIDVNEAYFIEYTIANNAGWTKANTVYQPSSGCKPTGDYAITHSLNFSQSDINGGDSKITTCVITTPKSSTANGCDWYNYTKTGNASIPTQTVNVGSVSNVKIRVDYYNTSGEETYWEGSGGTSLTVPQSAIITVTAIPNTGYYNSALTVGGGAFTSGSTYTVTATTAIAATFARSYAFIEGRFRVYNAARNTRTSVGGQGSWVKNSTNIPMSFDGTNGRFELHTYSTPAELKAAFTGGDGDADPYFYIKTSTASNSISSGNDDGPAEYWATSTSSNGNKLLNAGTANKRAVSKTSDALTFVGNSSSNDEYVILYCDGSYVWYELEYTLEYSAGTGSGTAPASKTYYNKGSKATVASNTFTAPSGYHFHHWSGSDGNTYAASDKVTMNSNVTLTAIWALDYPTGYIYITDVMATPATKAGTTITTTKNSANYKTALSSTFNTNRVGYEEWALTTGSSGSYQLAFSSALDLSSYTGGVDIDVWWGANDNNRTTTLKVNGGSAQALDEVSDSKDRNAVRKATVHTDVTSLSSIQLLCSNGNVAWFRIGIKETATYALTYDDNTDAEVSNMPTSPVNKPAGTITLASEIPTRSGYAFQGWTEDEENEGTVYAAGGSYTMPASAQTLYAKWAQTYTLTYDDGDGSGAPSAEEHVPGSITLSSTEPTRSGYVFLGWTVHGGDGTLYAAGGSYTMPSSDVTLDAEWEEICFQATITKTSSSYSVDGNSTKNITSDATITTGGSVICVNNNASSKSFSFSTDGVSPGTSDGYVEFVFPTGTILQTGTVIRVQGTADDASRGLLLIDDSGTTLASQTNNGAIKFSYEVTALSTINGNDHIRIKRANTSGKNAVKTIIITDCGSVSCYTPAEPTISGTASYIVGETIELTADITGSNHDSNTEYTWYKGADWATASAADPVQDAAKAASNGHIFTKTAAVGDAGTYWCLASNGDGCEAHNETGKAITVVYKVTYAANGGTGDAMANSTGTSITLSANSYTAPSGYTFDGWRTVSDKQASGTDYAAGTSSITANLDLYAMWKQTVTLDDNGGSNDGSAVVYYNASSASTPTAPTYSGYTADGYYAEPGCTNLILGTDGALTNYTDYVEEGKWIYDGAATLYAHYKCTAPTISCTDNVVTMSTTSTGATIYYTYTTDGSTPSDPTSSDDEYDSEEKPVITKDTQFKAIAIESGKTSSAVTSQSCTYTAFSSSVNIEQAVLDNGTSWGYAAALTAANISYDLTPGDGESVGLDNLNYACDKTDMNNDYRGLKIKSSGKYIQINLQAGKTLKVRFGHRGSAVKLWIDESAQTDIPTDGNYYTYELAAGVANRVVKIGTADAKAVVIKQIMIGEDIATVAVPAPISIADGITNGSISASSTANVGSTVTVTVTPSTGYELATLTYQACTGDPQDINQSTKQFTMPNSKVTLNATFVLSCSAPTSPSISGTTSYTVGDNISLTASATGTSGSSTYTWYKGATWDAASATSSIGSSATFSKASCVVADAGTYWCNISNGTGCDVQVSQAITVAKADISPVLTYDPTTLIRSVASPTPTLTGNTGAGTVTYSITASSPASAATINTSTGVVSPTKVGTITVTATIGETTNYNGNTATFELEIRAPYTVYFRAGDGTVTPTYATESSYDGVSLPTPTYASHTFLGWYNGVTNVGKTGKFKPTKDGIYLYAGWKETCAGGGGPSSSGSITLAADGTNKLLVWQSDSCSVTAVTSNQAQKTYVKLSANDKLAFYIWKRRASIDSVKVDLHSTTSLNTADATRKFLPTSGTGVTGYTVTVSHDTMYIQTSAQKYVNTTTVYYTVDGGSSCYYVTYDGNGATSGYTSDPTAYSAGDPVNAAYHSDYFGFKRTDYDFVEWNTAADGSGTAYKPSARITDNITSDITLYAQWGIVISSNNTNFAGKDTPTRYKDVRVTNGATLTLTQDTTVRDITVESGATLNVATNSGSAIKLTANSLTLVGGWTEINGQDKYDMPRVYIDPKSKIKRTNKDINFKIAVDHLNYYPIAVPFKVAMKDVVYDDVSLAGIATYGEQYAVKTYNGYNRANGVSPAWRQLSMYYPQDTLRPGHGYILSAVPALGWGQDTAVIRFPMKDVADEWLATGELGRYSTYIKDTVHVTAYMKEGDTDGSKTGKANSGWNLLGVPYMSCYQTGADMYDGDNVASPATIIQGKFNFDTGQWKDTTVRYVTIPTHDFTEYIQVNIEDEATVLKPGWCFFIQASETGNLRFLSASQEESSTLPYRVRRQQAPMPTFKTGIILSGNEASDKTSFLISDQYSAAEYEINADLEKMFGETGYTLATYSLSGETRLAYNAMSNADAENIIPIGYRAPADGEYTFSINPRYAENGAFESVNLIDYETGIVTDLLMSSYTFSTERTQNDARFALNVVKQKETPTGIENGANGANDANGVRKLLLDGKMYIILDGKMFDAQGKRVK